jgi:hypothetical protein
MLMRKPVYDAIIKDGLKKLEGREDFTAIEQRDAFNKILACDNEEDLAKYYRNMDEFFGAGMDDILKMDGRYLKAEETHMCVGDTCKHKEIGE